MSNLVRQKYIDEKLGQWFVFGVHKDGTVDVNDGLGDVLVGVSRENAARAIAAHARIMNVLYKVGEGIPLPEILWPGSRDAEKPDECLVCGGPEPCSHDFDKEGKQLEEIGRMMGSALQRFTVGQRVRFRGYQEYPADYPISKGALGTVEGVEEFGWPYSVKFDDHGQPLGMCPADLDAVCPRCSGTKSIWVGYDGPEDTAECPDCRGTGVTT